MASSDLLGLASVGDAQYLEPRVGVLARLAP